jgi:hypothetical protein
MDFVAQPQTAGHIAQLASRHLQHYPMLLFSAICYYFLVYAAYCQVVRRPVDVVDTVDTVDTMDAVDLVDLRELTAPKCRFLMTVGLSAAEGPACLRTFGRFGPTCLDSGC